MGRSVAALYSKAEPFTCEDFEPVASTSTSPPVASPSSVYPYAVKAFDHNAALQPNAVFEAFYPLSETASSAQTQHQQRTRNERRDPASTRTMIEEALAATARARAEIQQAMRETTASSRAIALEAQPTLYACPFDSLTCFHIS